MIQTGKILSYQYVSQVKGHIASDMAGEKVMLNVEKGKYYNLGEIGGNIWDIIENPISVEELLSQLISIYKIENIDWEKQVFLFLDQLLVEGLINVSVNP